MLLSLAVVWWYVLCRLAVLDAIRSFPLPHLELIGVVPISVAVADALAACCQHLTMLTVDCDRVDQQLPDDQQEGPGSYQAGIPLLLSLLGPRLRELAVLGGAQHWPTEAWGALRHCTGLTSLAVEAGVGETEDRDGIYLGGSRGLRPATADWRFHARLLLYRRPGLSNAALLLHVVHKALVTCPCTGRSVRLRHAPLPARLPTGSVQQEAHILRAVAQLPGLQSLCLRTAMDPCACKPQALAPHATSVACLSALTALTRLEFEPSLRYADTGEAWSALKRDGRDREAWWVVREQHRTALLFALRAMPQLQHLHCPTLWLRQPEAAPLTALTSLSVRGLLRSWPPSEEDVDGNAAPAGAHGHARSGAAGANPDDRNKKQPAPWPPQLKELVLDKGASPQALAGLRLPDSLRRFSCPVLRLCVSDLEGGGYITQQALEALGPAVRVLTNPATVHAEDEVEVVVDGGPKLLRPREDCPWGHAEWLGQLAGLDVFKGVKLKGVVLRVGDVRCLVRTWPNVRVSTAAWEGHGLNVGVDKGAAALR